MQYDSDSEKRKQKLKTISTLAASLAQPKKTSDTTQPQDRRQIIICTRTHSQMSQIVHELRRCETFSDRVIIVPLVSRKGLCVHPAIKDKVEAAAINEKCEDFNEKG